MSVCFFSGCFPQDVTQWDFIPGEHQQDLQGRYIQQLLCQLPDLGLSGPGGFLRPHVWQRDDLQGNRRSDLCYWCPGSMISTSRCLHFRFELLPVVKRFNALCASVCQDDYVEALGRLHLTVSRAYKVNPDINFAVFIHKVDGLSDDHKIETQRDIHQRANDDLADASLEKVHLRWEFKVSG